MMGEPLHNGVCVAILMLVTIAQVGAQSPGGSTEPPIPPPLPPPGGSKNYVNGPTSPSVAASFQESIQTAGKPLVLIGAAETTEDLETIGGTVEDEPSGRQWSVREHTYSIDDDSEGARRRVGLINGHTGGFRETWAGEATREGQRRPFATHEDAEGVEEQQVSGTSSDQGGDERPDSPGEAKHPPAIESADWSKESGLWRYREGEWRVVHLPDPSYLSLPTPPPPETALVVVTTEKVTVERSLEGLSNVTIYYSFYLSDGHHPDTLPELKVYHVEGNVRNLLLEETERGAWHARTVQVSKAENSSVEFEGWSKADENIIALRNVVTESVTLGRDEALDADSDQMTLTFSTTESVISAPEAQGNWTQNSESEGSISPATDKKDQDDAITGMADGTQEGAASDPSENTSQSPAEGKAEEGGGTEVPTEQSEFEVPTDSADNETQTSEHISGSTDVVTLNSSTPPGGNNVTSGGGASGDINSTATMTDEKNIETDEKESATATGIDDESGTSESGTEDVLGTADSGGQNSTLSIPRVTTDSLQTNTSVILLPSKATKTSGPLIKTEASGNLETPSRTTETRLTDEQNLPNTLAGDKDASKAFGTPQSNATQGNVIGETILHEGIIAEPTASPAGNSTEGVVVVPVSSTSWQVFQVFLVLCVMGLLALGFLYWKRKRRQDDEIPVFTRHTDYHNPTFTMEDAANFMSRGGRNAYKTIE